MRKVCTVCLLAVLTATLLSCATGPRILSRKWDDYENQAYVSNPWLTALCTDVVPAYPIVTFGAAIVDIYALNPYHFWVKDAWRNEGTPFYHTDPE